MFNVASPAGCVHARAPPPQPSDVPGGTAPPRAVHFRLRVIIGPQAPRRAGPSTRARDGHRWQLRVVVVVVVRSGAKWQSARVARFARYDVSKFFFFYLNTLFSILLLR